MKTAAATKKTAPAMPKAQDAATEAAALAAINGSDSKAIPHDAAGLDDDFATLVRERQKIAAKIEELEAAKRERTDLIQAILDASDHKSVTVDGRWQATWSAGRRGSKKLEPKLLLDKGVPASVIAACTVEGEPGKPYVVVTEIKKAQ